MTNNNTSTCLCNDGWTSQTDLIGEPFNYCHVPFIMLYIVFAICLLICVVAFVLSFRQLLLHCLSFILPNYANHAVRSLANKV